MRLLDCNLNGQSTAGIAEALSGKGVPFALVTGYERNGLPSAFANARVVGKPFNPEALLAVANELLQDQSQQA